MINDIDTIPLQRSFFEERWVCRPDGTLLAIGAELYNKTKDKGKFPISYMAAEGYVFKQLFEKTGFMLVYEDKPGNTYVIKKLSSDHLHPDVANLLLGRDKI